MCSEYKDALYNLAEIYLGLLDLVDEHRDSKSDATRVSLIDVLLLGFNRFSQASPNTKFYVMPRTIYKV